MNSRQLNTTEQKSAFFAIIVSERTDITAKFPYTRTDGTTGTVNLASVNLRAGEMRLLNLATVIQRSQKEQIKISGIEIEYNTAPGSVLVNAQSLSESGSQVFRVPMSDPLAQVSSTGGYPWRIDETSRTVSYIKNMTDLDQDYVAFLTWENGGEYMIGIREISPHKTIEIDVQKLRDDQTADFRGRRIPLSLMNGQIHWSLRQRYETDNPKNDRFALIGRSEQIDTVKRTSSNYVCQSCCEQQSSGFVSADPFGYRYSSYQFEVGDVVRFYAFEEVWFCYDPPGSPPRIAPRSTSNWSSSVTNVATVDSTGLVTIQNVGNVNVKAKFRVSNNIYNGDCPTGPYLTGDSDDCENDLKAESEPKAEKTESTSLAPGCGECFSYRPEISPTAAIAAKPKVEKIQYQEPGSSSFTDISGTLYVLKGSTVLFQAVPNSGSTFPSGSPIWSGTSGATGTGQTKSVTFNTVSSGTTDYKTVIAKGSANGVPKIVNVIVYELTGVLTPQDNFANRSLTRFGLEEIVDLSFTSTPAVTSSQAGGLRWTVQTGTIQIPPRDDGTGRFTAPEVAESSTLKLEILRGPSKAQFVTTSINIVAPSSAYVSTFSNIAHNYGAFGGGFRGYIHLEPRDVSFSRIRFSEGAVNATASGYLGHLNGRPHSATVGVANIGFCNAVAGCRLTVLDEIISSIDPAPAPHPTSGYIGSFHWAIPWRYHTATSMTSFMIGNHRCPSDSRGTAALEKQGAGPYFIGITDPTTGF